MPLINHSPEFLLKKRNAIAKKKMEAIELANRQEIAFRSKYQKIAKAPETTEFSYDELMTLNRILRTIRINNEFCIEALGEKFLSGELYDHITSIHNKIKMQIVKEENYDPGI